jgi:hypothetical protein
MGLGFLLMSANGGLFFEHSGSNLGYKGFLGGYKDRGQGVVVMTNGDNGLALCMEIVRGVAKVYDWPDFSPEQANLIDVPPAVLQAYVGNYKQTGAGMTFQIYVSGGGLMMKYELGEVSERLDMYPEPADTFLVRSTMQGTVVFSRDGSGNVTGFTLTSTDGTFVAGRI